ncbi:DNA-directed DNA polymerase [Solidesulfovibrio carbinoliphilus subsp. oakridgensis]|uniref:DNA polymerase IV n=1 Tax=Solidesulfovibrio carbinoliphilus subsp. oakridgensis TaxID=694327 RepID=G7Q9M1_9BACT|nr:DNA polymerase IV [Solidesulfovibrio carbinoliphilus]EHJ48661.1 DNA-directed DNA polymerase [Solidesulfovibrio carbinoliphilus subsp. oakridgensis]
MALILHLDMDAFFASVEQLDDPSLRGKPVIIGQDLRGVVSAASYEARVYGVRSAMPVAEARRRCPHGVFLSGNRRRYSEVSRIVMATLENVSPLVEPASIDEAYVDVTGTETLFGPPEALGRRVKQMVREATGLPCSVGIAPVKFIAKIASDYDKPDGLTVVSEADVPVFLADLPVGKIPGVGRRAEASLSRLGIRRVGDILAYPPEFLERHCGKWGLDLYAKAHGRGSTTVAVAREAKSVSAENTFDTDTADRERLASWLLHQSERIGRELRQDGLAGRTITLKLKFNDFRQITRSRTLPEPIDSDGAIFAAATALLDAEPLPRPVRLIGVGVSNFGREPRQLGLFENPDRQREVQARKIDTALDAIRGKFGRAAIVRGRLFDFERKRKERKGGGDG